MPKRKTNTATRGKKGGFLPLALGALALGKLLGGKKKRPANFSSAKREKGGYIPKQKFVPRLQVDKGYLINQPGAGMRKRKRGGNFLANMLHFLV